MYLSKMRLSPEEIYRLAGQLEKMKNESED